MITEDVWRGKRFEIPNKLLSWPQQGRLASRELLIWQHFLKRVVLSQGLILKVPLALWCGIEDGWQWIYSPSLDCLLRNDQGSWKFFSKIYRRDHLPNFSLMER